MKFWKLSALFSATVLCAQPAWCELHEILKTYRGVRSLGMGGVAFSTGAYDEALFSNPAMASYNETSRVEILSPTVEANTHFLSHIKDIGDIKGASGSDAIAKIADKGLAGENQHFRFTGLFAWYSPKLFGENTGFSIGLVTSLQANIMLRSDADLDAQAFEDAGPALNVSHKMLDGNFSIGANARAIYRLASSKSVRATEFLGGTKLSLSSLGGQGIGVDGDIGATYRLPEFGVFFKTLWLAASFNNVAQSSYRIAGRDLITSVKASPPRNDRTLNLGVRSDLPDACILTKSLFAVEIQDLGALSDHSSFWKRLHFGGETHLSKLVSLRAGVNQGYATGGVGIALPVLNIEVATYGEELGTNTGQLEDRRVALRLGVEI